MAVQSIWTSVQVRNVARDHFLVVSREMAFREMNGIGKFDYLPKEIRARPETLDNSWHLLSTGAGAPVVICGGHVPTRFGIFGDPNLGCRRRRLRFVRRLPGKLAGFFVHGSHLVHESAESNSDAGRQITLMRPLPQFYR